jgi:hypothetical protein
MKGSCVSNPYKMRQIKRKKTAILMGMAKLAKSHEDAIAACVGIIVAVIVQPPSPLFLSRAADGFLPLITCR